MLGADDDGMHVKQNRLRPIGYQSRRAAARQSRAASRPLWTMANSSELRLAARLPRRGGSQSPLRTASPAAFAMPFRAYHFTALNLSTQAPAPHLLRAAPRMHEMSVPLLLSRLRFGRPVRPSCWARKASPRLGALAARCFLTHQHAAGRPSLSASNSREIDHRAIGRDMLPGSRRAFVAEGSPAHHSLSPAWPLRIGSFSTSARESRNALTPRR